ncbi:MAG: endo alpha-1,4 polygalactosaminidase [gamma proteobacterium symbiont of Taylorina sp.]|nr:endo alpha-1,4 polygalactosaminidase [gamma proteobacterium symbiont of Taylorina sp.]
MRFFLSIIFLCYFTPAVSSILSETTIDLTLNIDYSTGLDSGNCQDYFDLSLSLETEDLSTPADWWLIHQNAQSQFSSLAIANNAFKPGINAIYQGDLISFDKLTIEPECQLDAGLNIFYFVIDGNQNGSLDFDPFIFSAYPVKAAADNSRQQRLNNSYSWMYQIQGLDEDGAIETLDKTEYDMLVLEPGHNYIDYPYNTQEIISQLRTTSDGKKRLLLAYIDIGQAEDYRDYWQSDWVAPTATQRGQPDFMITIDPDGWSGNFNVAYWKQEWKDLWLGDNGIIAKLARFGFDGIYLDWVEAYDDDPVRQAAAEDEVNPETEMIHFIKELGQAGKTIIPDFLVISQNAPYLIDADKYRYLSAIDGLAVEDTWFHGAGDAKWDASDAGDLHARHDDEWSTDNRLEQYEQYQQAGLPVFSVDYCISTSNAAQVYTDAKDAGLRPLVTRVSLSRLTETPPDFE